MIKTPTSFYRALTQNFKYPLSILQNEMLQQFSNFVFSEDQHGLFLLKGYAGTGKTSLISLIVNYLPKFNFKVILLAPTGRAAKVLSVYATKEASTIHRKIYQVKNQIGNNSQFILTRNKHTNTLFFVDEASMIGEQKLFEFNNNNNTSLLDDLMQYVYSGKNCKLVLIGDTAQLPPVKTQLSPALDIEKLTYKYAKNVIDIELTEVMRQEENSGILSNATSLRNIITEAVAGKFQFNGNFSDVIRLSDSYEIEDAIMQSYDNWSIEDTVIIVRSNKRANLYNQQIRTNILGRDNEISTGDYMMIVKNNYYWLHPQSKAGFIANGDTCEILEIFDQKELYGFHFARVKIRLIDYPEQIPFETVLLLDTLNSNTASLSSEDSNKLYLEVSKDYEHLKSKYKIYQSIKENPYFNALQVKYAYTVTCHKAQGGQWKNVIIEKPWLPDGESVEYWRWLYTALTRAEKKVYLVGFKEDDFIS